MYESEDNVILDNKINSQMKYVGILFMLSGFLYLLYGIVILSLHDNSFNNHLYFFWGYALYIPQFFAIILLINEIKTISEKFPHNVKEKTESTKKWLIAWIIISVVRLFYSIGIALISDMSLDTTFLIAIVFQLISFLELIAFIGGWIQLSGFFNEISLITQNPKLKSWIFTFYPFFGLAISAILSMISSLIAFTNIIIVTLLFVVPLSGITVYVGFIIFSMSRILDDILKSQTYNTQVVFEKLNEQQQSYAEMEASNFCTNCGVTLSKSAKFCTNCGKQIKE
ncbi:MAG: zinc ribbon domain-containing protein [Candidatus Heimdallarchaeaceae archaeon]